jgi:hypothetical protein
MYSISCYRQSKATHLSVHKHAISDVGHLRPLGSAQLDLSPGHTGDHLRSMSSSMSSSMSISMSMITWGAARSEHRTMSRERRAEGAGKSGARAEWRRATGGLACNRGEEAEDDAWEVGCQRCTRKRSRERCSAGLSAVGGALCCASADS